MTPQEKAKELRDKFQDRLFDKRDVTIYQEDAVECALIAVDEIINELVELSNGEFTFIHKVEYWQAVKQELAEI